MNEIKIYLNPSGSTAELYKDFNLYRESYRNVQISIYVPTVMLYKNADNTFLNTVQTGAIITAPNGAKVPTISYNAAYVKTIMRGNVEYAEYTQVMPKEFALYAGTQTIVCNVLNIDNTDPSAPKIIEITTTQRAPLIVLESAYLSSDEPLDPSQVDVLEGRVNELYTFKDEMAAFYITSNAQGDAFATKAALTDATMFYSGGAALIPKRNDYAWVLADESQPKNADGTYPTTRYSWQGGTYPDGQWDFQYVVNNTPLTQPQVDALNSGITEELVTKLYNINLTDYYTKTETDSKISAAIASAITTALNTPV